MGRDQLPRQAGIKDFGVVPGIRDSQRGRSSNRFIAPRPMNHPVQFEKPQSDLSADVP
jgi:hypothetical protein